MLSIIWVSLAFLTVIITIIIMGWRRRVYKEWFGNMESSSVQCVVCLSKVAEGEKIRSLPICGHGFHAHCIESWLKVRPNCPLCRINVTPHENFPIPSLLSYAKRLGNWIENPLSLELSSAVCESFGYI